MVEKVSQAFAGLDDKTVCVLGLSFKPETDDIRESPALEIIDHLLAAGAQVRVFDPVAMPECRPLWPDVYFAETSYDAAKGADGVVIATEWNQFRALELGRLKKLLSQPLIVDLRNIYEPAKMKAAGFEYISVGRPTARLEEVEA